MLPPKLVPNYLDIYAKVCTFAKKITMNGKGRNCLHSVADSVTIISSDSNPARQT